MNSKKPLPAIVKFAILTLITTVVWIGFDVYRAFTKGTPSTVPEEVLRALDADLDEEILQEITQKVHLEDEEIGDTELVNIQNLQSLEEISTEESSIPEETAEEEITDEEVVDEETTQEETTDENIEN